MEESMSGKRKTYTKAFKLDAIAQVTQANQNVESVAEKLGIRTHLLKRWIRLHKQLGDKAFPGMGYSFPADNQTTRIHELEAEVQRLRTENIILKKASIVFAREINLTAWITSKFDSPIEESLGSKSVAGFTVIRINNHDDIQIMEIAQAVLSSVADAQIFRVTECSNHPITTRPMCGDGVARRHHYWPIFPVILVKPSWKSTLSECKS